MTSSTACHVCGNQNSNVSFACSEKMFGLGDAFAYFQCAHCQCLQLAIPPDNWDRYYPKNYFSFSQEPVPMRGFKAWRYGKRDHWMLTGKGWFGRRFSKARAPLPEFAALRRAGATAEKRILDVGCGRGQLLSALWRAGFRNLAGTDPFLPPGVQVMPELNIQRRSLEQIEGTYDIIMMHHVFEHLADPRSALLACAKKLRPGGQVIIRIPTVDSDAWEKYRENWVDLDCPRHLHLFSRKSLQILAEQTGFTIKDCYCDSDGFQFWGSELYLRGVPLNGAGGGVRSTDHFSREQLDQYEQKGAAANAAGRGDQIAVLLTPQAR